MTLSVGQSIAIIAVCAACTFFERWLPWLLFGRRAVPKVVEYLGRDPAHGRHGLAAGLLSARNAVHIGRGVGCRRSSPSA